MSRTHFARMGVFMALGFHIAVSSVFTEEARLKEIGQARKSIGRARRSEKIRTYNFPQNRVTDHRIKESWHNLEGILSGDLKDVVTTVITRLTPEE